MANTANMISTASDWAVPDLTSMTPNANLSSVPAFPLDVLGLFWSDYILSGAGDKLPRDFFALNVLGTMSGLIGNGLEAAMPSPSTIREPATLWMINVGPPGAGKTPAFTPFLEAVGALEETSGVVRKIEDTTIAGAIRMAIDTPEGLVVMNDELSGWWDCFNRDRGGEQFWLKAWNGKMPYAHNRGGRGGEPSKIPRHNIAVLGGTQPATLPTMLKATSDIERGFVSRCLFAYPDPVSKTQKGTGHAPNAHEMQAVLERVFELASLGLRSVPVTDEAAAHHADWSSRFNAAELFLDTTKPDGQRVSKQYGMAIRLALVLETTWWAAMKSPDKRVMKRAQQYAALADAERNDKEGERAAAQKKLDALIHAYGFSADGTWQRSETGPAAVTLRAMQAACDLIETYFYPHFQRCQQSAYPPPHLKAAKDLTMMLVRRGSQSFNARLLQKYEEFGQVSPALHGSGAGEMVEEVCDHLESLGVIRLRITRKVGRKAKDYDVNPHLFAEAKKYLR